MTSHADAYLDAAESAAELLGHDSVAARWDEPSALAEFSVRGLAGHLASQVLNVAVVLEAPMPHDIQTLRLEDHYSGVAWRGAEVDAEVNVGIRDGGERLAAAGQTVLLAAVRSGIDELRSALADIDGAQPVYLPWAGWALTLDDFLTTRMMEIAVHSDDLAVSVGVATPELPVRVMHPVYDLLFVLALRRHGQTAVLRALSRAERAPATIAAI